MQPEILIVEDEPPQAEVLRYNLEREGYRTRVARDGEEALLLISEETPDLVLLDWMLPLTSGIEVCRRLRARPETRRLPVVMLTARGEEGDRVRGLDCGADDYVVKPFSVDELLARVRAVLRRADAAVAEQRLSHGGVVLDKEAHRVTRDGDEVALRPMEFRLLAALLERRGRVLSRERLLDLVWGRDAEVGDRTVDVHVGRLRKALNKGGRPDIIRTVQGAGYAIGD